MKPSNIKESWYKLLKPLFESKKMLETRDFLRGQKPFSPDFKDVFRIFSLLEVDDVKCIIIGLSPYQSVVEGSKIATGIPFGVKDASYDTPSLKVIRDALSQDIGIITVEDYFDYTLESWVKQGVLLLNASLTVKTGGDARSHLNEWAWFTGNLIKILNDKYQSMPFVFLGKDAQVHIQFVNEDKNHVIKAHHPAAVYYDSSKDFSKQNIFNKINEIITKVNGDDFKIKWLWNL